MRGFLSLLRRELLNQFSRPALYVLCVAYWVLSGMLAFKVLLDSGVVTLTPYFQLAPILFLLFTLAITTGQLNFRQNQLDLLRLLPVSPFVVVTARLATVMLILLIALAGGGFIPLGVTLAGWGVFDFGQLVSANFGLFLLGMAFSSVGLAVGSFSRNQTAAFLVAFVVVFFFWIPEHLVPFAPEALKGVLAQLSFGTHLFNWSRGILWLPDLAYFLVFAGVGLFLAQLGWESWRTRKLWFRAFTWRTPAALLVLVLFQLFSLRFPLRLDLTSEKVFTMDPATVQVARNLKKEVKILFFCSSNLPRELVPVRQDVLAFLEEYSRLSGNLQVQVLAPESDPEVGKLARNYGIGEMEIGKKSATSTQLNRILFGMAIVTGNVVETIPDVSGVRSLEYEVTFRLKRLMGERPRVVFTSEHGEFPETAEDPRGGFDRLFSSIPEFEMVRQKGEIPPDAKVLVIAGPLRPFSDGAWTTVTDFLKAGKSVLILADGMMFRNNRTVRGVPRHWVPNHSLRERLGTLGISLGEDMILSLSAPRVSVSEHKVVTFPLMPMIDVSRKLTIMPFTVSSLDMDASTGFHVERKLRSDPGAWRHQRAYEENFDWPRTGDTGRFSVGIFARPRPESSWHPDARLVAIGDSDLFRDFNYNTVNTHQLFFREIMDYLIRDNSLAHLRQRGRTIQRLKLDTNPGPAWVMTFVIGTPVLLLLGAGMGFWLFRQKRRGKSK